MTLPANRPVWMTERERAVAKGFGLAAAIFFIAFWRPWESGVRAAFTAIGVIPAVGLWATARWGHSVFAALAAFIVGVFAPWDYLYVIGAVYVGLAFWIVRSALRRARGGQTTPNESQPGARADRKKPNSSARRRTNDRNVGS